MRRVIAFDCDGATLFGTLDGGSRDVGVLIVAGGNEVRAGPHRSMALLAARLAAEGVAVLRYDRRGVGDSEGANAGFAGAGADLAAALTTLRREAGVRRVVAYGNCDAAALLALEGQALGIEAVVLSNPWTGDEADALPPAAAIRAGYAAKLRDPREWWRLLRGGVDLRKLARGLAKVFRAPSQDGGFAAEVARAVAGWGERATVVLARGDATAIAFAAVAGGVAVTFVESDSHGFARAGDMDAVEAAIRAAVSQV